MIAQREVVGRWRSGGVAGTDHPHHAEPLERGAGGQVGEPGTEHPGVHQQDRRSRTAAVGVLDGISGDGQRVQLAGGGGHGGSIQGRDDRGIQAQVEDQIEHHL
jgi:hypothetical protein